jgi:hypothetical protein
MLPASDGDALVEQLALHEEFESIAVDNGTKGNRRGY